MKKLHKSNNGRQLCGVCAGLGEYFGIDADIFRLIFILLTISGGAGVIWYFAAALIMPQEAADVKYTSRE